MKTPEPLRPSPFMLAFVAIVVLALLITRKIFMAF
jgi:hypothetical protein